MNVQILSYRDGYVCIYEENPSMTDGFLLQMAGKAENVFLSWRCHEERKCYKQIRSFFSSSFCPTQDNFR